LAFINGVELEIRCKEASLQELDNIQPEMLEGKSPNMGQDLFRNSKLAI
jgi:hypothetical protein